MPQPVDFQTEVAKTTAAQRVQEITERASLASQLRGAAEAKENRASIETQVQQTAESGHAGVDADGRRKNPFVGRRAAKRLPDGEPEQDTKKRQTVDGEGTVLDVSI